MVINLEKHKVISMIINYIEEAKEIYGRTFHYEKYFTSLDQMETRKHLIIKIAEMIQRERLNLKYEKKK